MHSFTLNLVAIPVRPRKRSLMWNLLAFSTTLTCLPLGGYRLDAGPVEVRGTWLTTTGPDHIASGLNTNSVATQLRTVGINTVYVEAWKNGFTNFASPTLDATIGQDRTPSLGNRDLLHETLIGAHRNSMIHVAWFEYGFSSQFVGNGGTPTNALSQYMINQGWLLQDQLGRYGNASNGFAWMNPAVPQVRQLLIDLAVESARNYDIDGVQFDDRLAWPKEFGWDATTEAIYHAETGRSLPASVDDAQFRAWRQSKVALFAHELNTALKAADPMIFISVSPSITGFSDTQYNAVWTDWLNDGLFDEYVPQVYRDNLGSFNNTLPANIAPFSATNRLDDVVVGIRFNGTGADTPINDVQQMIVAAALAESGSLSGHSLFYSKGLINNSSAMVMFYGDAVQGPAPHPVFGLDHRPDPRVASQSPTDPTKWTVDISDSGNYRVAVLQAGRWAEVDVRAFTAGIHELSIVGAEAVELLVSRRLPAIVDGDFNHDGTYDCTDINALVLEIVATTDRLEFDLNADGVVNSDDLADWLDIAGAAKFASGNPVLPGDANLDGQVDGQDFLTWNAHKFTETAEWCAGDFNADGIVDGRDFLLWNTHKFTSSEIAAVPEQQSGLCWLLIAWQLTRRRRATRRRL